jgi:predicted PurR-regulated permease PerM
LVTEARQLAAGIPAAVTRTEKKIENWISHPPPVFHNLRRFLEPATNPPPGSVPETNAPPPEVSPETVSANTSATNNPAVPPPVIKPQTLETAADWLAKGLPQAGVWLFGQVGRVASWFGVLVGLALVPVYTFYFLLEKRGISSRWTDYLPVTDSSFKNELVFVLNSINNYLITFFRGQVLVALCDGVLYGLGFLIVGLPYALLIGVAAVFLTIIPFLGAIIVCTSALLIALVQFGDWQHPLLVLAVFGTVQALEGLVISPKIMGGRVGLHPVTIIIAVMAGTTLLGGLLGGILAIPLTAALRVVMLRYVWKRPAPESESP